MELHGSLFSPSGIDMWPDFHDIALDGEHSGDIFPREGSSDESNNETGNSSPISFSTNRTTPDIDLISNPSDVCPSLFQEIEDFDIGQQIATLVRQFNQDCLPDGPLPSPISPRQLVTIDDGLFNFGGVAPAISNIDAGPSSPVPQVTVALNTLDRSGNHTPSPAQSISRRSLRVKKKQTQKEARKLARQKKKERKWLPKLERMNHPGPIAIPAGSYDPETIQRGRTVNPPQANFQQASQQPARQQLIMPPAPMQFANLPMPQYSVLVGQTETGAFFPIYLQNNLRFMGAPGFMNTDVPPSAAQNQRFIHENFPVQEAPAHINQPAVNVRPLQFANPEVPADFVANPNNHGRWVIDKNGKRYYLNAPKAKRH